MAENVNIEFFREFIKKPFLRLMGLTAAHSKTLLRGIWNYYLFACRKLPGADIIFLGIFLKEIKMYVLYPFHLDNFCLGIYVSWLYDLYVTYFIVTGFVIYLTRRYILTRKTS